MSSEIILKDRNLLSIHDLERSGAVQLTLAEFLFRAD